MSLMLRLNAIGELFHRYRRVFNASWAVRDALEPPKRMRYELAFLPAALELADTPVHPAPRAAMIGISVLVVLLLGIALIGQLDIVVSAKGKLVPNERVKLVQPAVTGVVRRIHVQDGQRVAAGDLLLELDPTQAAADTSKAHSSKVAA